MTKYTPIIIITILIGATVILPDTTVFAETQAGDYWVSKAPIPMDNPSFVAVQVNKKIFVIGETTHMYDPAADKWFTREAMPAGQVPNFAICVVEDKIYCIGGQNKTDYEWSDSNMAYDITTDTWSTKASMPTPRGSVDMHVIDGKIYVIGGEVDALTIVAVNEVYDPATDGWETKSSMPTLRLAYCVHVVDGKIYVIGGRDTYIPGTYRYSKVFDTNEVYDPKTDTWTTLTPMPVADEGYLSAVMNDKIYVFGRNATCIYDPKKDLWSIATAIPTFQYNCKTVVTSGVFAPKKIYVIGGYTDPHLNSMIFARVTNLTQVYDPMLDSWSLGSEMPTARTGLYVFAVDDLFYTLGGHNIYSTHNYILGGSYFNVNEAYFPIGYGTPDPSYIPPTPTPTPNTQPDSIQPELILILCVLIIATVAVVFGYIFKRKQCGRVR